MPTLWSDLLCIGEEACELGDVNGDGMADAVAFVKSTRAGTDTGDVYVALSTGAGFAPAKKWADFICIDEETCAIADVNGDRKADAVAFVKSTRAGTDTGDVYVALSTGAGFAPAKKWADFICIDEETCALGDVDGDGKADAVAFVKSTRAGDDKGDVWVAAATAAGFGAATKWADYLCVDDETCTVADVNGDFRADAVAFVKSTRSEPDKGDVWVATSSGATFADPAKWADSICVDDETCAVADVNGDHRADAMSFVKSTRGGVDKGDIWVSESTEAGFVSATKWGDNLCVDSETCAVGDLNGDLAWDVVAFVKSTRGAPDAGDIWIGLAPAPIDDRFHTGECHLFIGSDAPEHPFLARSLLTCDLWPTEELISVQFKGLDPMWDDELCMVRRDNADLWLRTMMSKGAQYFDEDPAPFDDDEVYGIARIRRADGSTFTVHTNTVTGAFDMTSLGG